MQFRKMLNKELSHFAESSKAGNQISQYIFSTFMGKTPPQASSQCELALCADKETVDLPALQVTSEEDGVQGPSSSQPPARKDTSSAAASMSTIPVPTLHPSTLPSSSQRGLLQGIKPATPVTGVDLPKFGVPVPDEGALETVLAHMDRWGLDLFRLADISCGSPLTVLTYKIVESRGLLREFGLKPHQLVNYLRRVEEHYQSANPYHNSTHAADVVQSINVLLASPALDGVFTDLEVLAALFASAIHDVDHPGFTNHFLVNTGHQLAIMYNDESVLEHHHLAVAFQLLQVPSFLSLSLSGKGMGLQEPDVDIFRGWNPKQRSTLRKIVIDMVP